MKKLRMALLASAAVVGAGGGAYADDSGLAYKAPPIPYANWTGPYVGAHVGVARLNSSCTGSSYYDYYVCGSYDYDYFTQTSASASDTSFLGGGQIGYDWQDRNFVYGVAADWSWTGLKAAVANYYGSYQFKSQVDWLASIRGRAGLAVDNTLMYLTGGLALGHVQGEGCECYTGYSYLWDHIDQNRAGWVAGVGVEHKFTPHFSGFAEVLYYDLGHAAITQVVYSETYSSYYTFEVIAARVGLNYRF